MLLSFKALRLLKKNLWHTDVESTLLDRQFVIVCPSYRITRGKELYQRIELFYVQTVTLKPLQFHAVHTKLVNSVVIAHVAVFQ